jgi:predicted TIM-barrel fold metal-dependent hydrolase
MSQGHYETIVDSHVHWGPSITLGMEVTTPAILREQKESGVTHVIILPFPSTAIMNNDVNAQLLAETQKVAHFIPYFYIRENFSPIPPGYFGGKWHWMRGWQDTESNYNVLQDSELPDLVEKLLNVGKPIIFEEELDFTVQFVDRFPDLKLIIPHLGMLGGNPLDFLRRFKNKENIYFDTALGQTGTIHEFVRTLGPERVIFGSDIPFGSMENELSKVLAVPLNNADTERILYRNILELTGYPLSDNPVK